MALALSTGSGSCGTPDAPTPTFFLYNVKGFLENKFTHMA
jgi:hypothetical protein